MSPMLQANPSLKCKSGNEHPNITHDGIATHPTCLASIYVIFLLCGAAIAVGNTPALPCYCRWQYARAAVLLPLAIRTAWHGYVLGLAPLRAYTVLARLCARAIALARIHRAGAAMCSGWRPCAHTPCWRGYVLGLSPLRAYARAAAIGAWPILRPCFAPQYRGHSYGYMGNALCR